jgi:threonine synthase
MPVSRVDCTRCDWSDPPGAVLHVGGCGAPLFARYDLARAARSLNPAQLGAWEASLWRYAEVLPVERTRDRVSLGEGFPPLLSCPRLGAALGCRAYA